MKTKKWAKSIQAAAYNGAHAVYCKMMLWKKMLLEKDAFGKGYFRKRMHQKSGKKAHFILHKKDGQVFISAEVVECRLLDIFTHGLDLVPKNALKIWEKRRK